MLLIITVLSQDAVGLCQWACLLLAN